jgi:hypothetical protein
MLRSMRTVFLALFFAAAPLRAAEVPMHGMGEPVPVGALTYTVPSATWRSVEEPGREKPVEYLEVQVLITNRGEDKAGIPPFRIFDEAGGYYEDNDSKRVFPKMTLEPGETVRGSLFFQQAPRDGKVWFVAASEFGGGAYAYVALETAPVRRGGDLPEAG